MGPDADDDMLTLPQERHWCYKLGFGALLGTVN